MNSGDKILLATWREPGEVAIRASWKAMIEKKSLLEALEAGLSAAEDDPNLIAIGRGSIPNEEGVIELDASIMNGTTLEAGAVCGLRDILPAISIAKLVMEKTPHVMIAGNEARNFAIKNGFQPQDLQTDRSRALYDHWKAETHAQWMTSEDYVHSVADLDASQQHLGDTVTMLGLECVGAQPHCVAASSTSGLSWKKPGRVGDSPIIGAGIYADDEIGCAGSTGWGEELWKGVCAFRTVDAMRRGATAQQSCEETIRHLIRRQPKSIEISCVVFALSKEGDFGAAVTTGTFTLWVCKNGALESYDYNGLHDAT